MAHRSTDFEVHRNWIAVTSVLPRREWYTDATSEWTLDYPPFFAHFEHALGRVARAAGVSKRLFELSATPVADDSVVAFQRLSVVGSELLLWGALWVYARAAYRSPVHRACLVAANALVPALLVVDHIHFQYNGMLAGLLVLSLAAVATGRHAWAAFAFTTLLHFKHIYLYLALPYFVYLLRHTWRSPSRLLRLATIVVGVSAASLLPFAHQWRELAARLFPFKRGLTHAYPAANLWALYSCLDRALILAWNAVFAGGKASHKIINAESFSRGLVGESAFVFLPTVTPRATFALTVAAQLPALWKLWRSPSPRNFMHALTIAALTSFMLGWHVHEKAILMALLPLGLTFLDSESAFESFEMAQAAGSFAVFPLLIEPEETPVKILLLAGYCVTIHCLRPLVLHKETLHRHRWRTGRRPLLLFAAGLAVLQLFTTVVHPLWLAQTPKLSFLPQLLTFVYCALALIWVYVRHYAQYMRT